MRNLYTVPTLALVLIGCSLRAQGPTVRPLPVKDRTDPTLAIRTPAERSAEREVIWSNDFSNPGDWTMGSTTGHLWTIGTAGSQGPYTSPINSTTADNGFAVFYYGNTGGSGYQNAWLQVATPIDLSDHPFVVLLFEQFYRQSQAEYFLETSTDGTNWTSKQINNNLGTYVPSPNPELTFFNLSDEIGGHSTAYFRFRYESNAGSYAWLIDDVELVIPPEYDLILTNDVLAQFGEQAGFGGAVQYHSLPRSQIGNSVQVGASVSNYGSSVQTNVQLHISLEEENGTEVASETVDLGTMVGGEEVEVDLWMTIPPYSYLYGNHICHFSLSSDNIGEDASPDNNSAVRYMTASDDWYALDGIGIIPDDDLVLTSLGTNSFDGFTTDVRLLVYYEVHQTRRFTGIEIGLANGTDPGSYFIGSIYDTSQVLSYTMNWALAESYPHIITDNDLAAGRAFVEFQDHVYLQPGGYFAVASLYREAGNDLLVADDLTVRQPYMASLLWLNDDDYNLYSNGNAWAVRLRSPEYHVSVQENPTLEGVTMYPNPTSGSFEVHVTKAGNMTVEVFNTLGALVQTSQFNGTTTQLDLTGQAAGVYTVRVGDGTNFNVQRVTLK